MYRQFSPTVKLFLFLLMFLMMWHVRDDVTNPYDKSKFYALWTNW